MSRYGYDEDCDNDWSLIRYRGQVASAIKGKRGQAFLRELADALDAMPQKRLIRRELWNGEVCAIGALGVARGLDMTTLDADDYEHLAKVFGVAHQLVQEIEFENDENSWNNETPERRWERMREWVSGKLRVTP